MVFRDQVKPELMQSQIEVGSHVCRNIREIRQEVVRLRSMVAEVAEKHDRVGGIDEGKARANAPETGPRR